MIVRPAATIEGFRSEATAVKGVRLHYWIGGDPHGRPVILWHGFLGTAYGWRKVAPRLAEAGLAVLVPDMRGYGDSDKPEGTEGYDARALAEECRALVAESGFGGGRPIVLAGHDMGALPALIWAADHPGEVAGLLYIEAPVALSGVLQGIIRYEQTAMKDGSAWWWILPHAAGVPDRLVVGREREFLTWFYDRHTAKRGAIEPEAVDEYLRTFSGREGVLGAMGVYRAAFTSIDQTEPLQARKVVVPVIALGGLKSLGPKVGEMVKKVAETVEAHTLPDGGHFLPEECPDEVVRHVLALGRR